MRRNHPMNALIQQAADHLIKSKYAIALTGAGISTESGIKGYRKNWARLIQKIYEGDPPYLPQVPRADAHHFLP